MQAQLTPFYQDLCARLDALTAGEPDCIANLSNAAALLWQLLPQINWVGFYRVHRRKGAETSRSGAAGTLAGASAGSVSRAGSPAEAYAPQSESPCRPQTPGWELLLAPFAGKPACIHIAPGRGVCGTAALQNAAQNVPDVHRFPGHIACDDASCSELVIPLRHEGRVVGVLDLDSPLPARFTPDDQRGLEQAAALLSQRCGAQLLALEGL